MMNDAITLVACMVRTDIDSMNDAELQQLCDLDYVVALAKDIRAKRRVEAESKAIQDKAIARRNLGVTINDMVHKVREIPEYKQLVMLAGLMSYSQKRGTGEGHAVKLAVKIEETLEKYDLNDPRVVAHLVNAAG
jgi:hypothetical protein